MRLRIALSLLVSCFSPALIAQTCTGLCQQQVSCPAGQTTSITGTVYAPNGTDPLPNVTVYIPNAPVDAFTPGVSCPVPGAVPSGSPLVGTTTGFDGSFTLTNVPVGSNIPLVIVAGRWRRQLVVPGTAACGDTSFSASMPKNQGEGDIPKFAIATGSVDSVECVLRKVGVDAAEFTNPSGTGRIHLYSGSNRPGARIDTSTPSEDTLMGTASTLNQYDVLMLPCEGGQFNRNSTQLANFVQFANAGGRVYGSHFAYVWMYQNPPFNGVANWAVNQAGLATNGTATIDTTFTDGSTLAQWLQLVGASTTLGQIGISQIKKDTNGVIAPTQSWLTLNDSSSGNPVQQFTFNTPIGATNQCGRVLFNEYHVENPTSNSQNVSFPNECSNTTMTAQEKLLEFSLFNLSNDGGAATISRTSLDFGSVPVGFTSAAQTVTWKNNSIFAVTVSSAAATGDFSITSKNCGSVASGASCTLGVVFTPTVLGARTGTLTVKSSSNTLTTALTGNGTVAITTSTSSLSFGRVDVGASSAPQTVTLTNTAPGTVATPAVAISGDYAMTSTCGSTIAAAASCAVAITFKPTTTGTRTGTLTVANAAPSTVQLTGTGVDFTLTLNPTSGSVIAGRSTTTIATITPVSGFANSVALTCTTTAPASSCTPALTSFIPTAAIANTITITTASEYTVIGYSGLGGSMLLTFFSLGGGLLLYRRRTQSRTSSWTGLAALLLTAAGIASLSGCSGKTPDRNAVYTTPGTYTYTYTITATDGTITHSATYSLAATAK